MHYQAYRVAGALLVLMALVAATPTAAQEETLDITFTTSVTSSSGPGGFAQFTPNNYVVVWLEDSSGNFVQTLGRWGENFWYDLRDWALTSGHDVDAITGATQTAFGALSVSGAVISGIPDGSYEIVMESTEWEIPEPGQNNLARFAFNKNGTGVSLTPAASGGFSGVGIVYSGRTSGNYAPGVWAGHEMWVTLPATPAMTGVATDDGGTPTVTWSHVSGPATAAFTDANDLTTTVTFPAAGRYVLRLTANDGGRSSSDEVTVWVNATVLNTVADTAVNSGAAGTNYGGSNWINVNDTNQAYLRFDLSSITDPVSSATLRLATAEGGYSSVLRQIRRVSSDTWNEMSITWSSRPGADSTVLATIGTDRGWVEADLTTAVQAEIAGDGVLSLNLRSASTPSQWILYNSKDVPPTSVGAHYTPPQLVVFTASSSTPSLSVSLSPDNALENAGVLSSAGTVTLSEAPGGDLAITLTSGDTSAVTLPATVTATTGSTSVTFDVTVVDDTVDEADQVVSITAVASGYTSGSANFTVRDDDDAPPDDADTGPDASTDAVDDTAPDVAADTDADPAEDTTTTGPSDAGGCGCRIAHDAVPACPAVVLALLLVVLARRRGRA